MVDIPAVVIDFADVADDAGLVCVEIPPVDGIFVVVTSIS
jgi:hypothetical protein